MADQRPARQTVAAAQLELPISSPWCQRSTPSGGIVLRHVADPFNPDRYGVTPIDQPTAKSWVRARHYAASYPADKLRYGLFDLADGNAELVGVAVLSIPVNAAVLTGPFPGLAAFKESLDLGRFLLADNVPGNGESWFLGQVCRLAAQEGVRGLVSYADPLIRTAADGRIICPGHVGVIYQSVNMRYLGRGTARTLTLLPDGTVLSDRAAAKIRKQEQGHAYAEQLLLRHGARPLEATDEPGRWLREALVQVGARRIRHRGCHRYALPIGRTRRERAAIRIGGTQHPYPRRNAWAGPP